MKIEPNNIYLGDCLDIMPHIEDGSIDMILCDLPYGTTNCKWDVIIPFEPLWKEYKRIIKNNGAIVLTASQPFTSLLIASNIELFKYELIWEKTIGSGQLNIKHQPLRVHENILVFYTKIPVYNEQKTIGTPYSISRKAGYKSDMYNQQKSSYKNNEGFRHARSVIKISNPRIKGGHPTQKPLELFEYLIKVYTNENDLVLDNCIGSGTTAVAATNLNRQFVGIESNNEFYDKAVKRIAENQANFATIKRG